MIAGARVRAYRPEDFDALTARWHESNVESFPYVEVIQAHTLADDRRFFRDHVVPAHRIFVATDAHGGLSGFIAVDGCWIRHLAVFREAQRRGVGTALLGVARSVSPGELRAFTFQRNERARAFYARHGFAEVRFGVSPAPELEPDVEVHWRAAAPA